MFFFFNDTATTEIYTLSLHDALPISGRHGGSFNVTVDTNPDTTRPCIEAVFKVLNDMRKENVTDKELQEAKTRVAGRDRKSTRLNSSHANISYAVFCLKKKKTIIFPP